MQAQDMAVRSRLRVLLAEHNVERARAGRSGLTVRQLAEQTGLAASTITGLTAGRARQVSFATLDALCRYFGCTPNDLLEYTPSDTPPE
jgi:putative transcriptional regulator